ncbi:MAG: membrane protein insertion efficiency factor YidD [Acidobacteriaceae bacterium]
MNAAPDGRHTRAIPHSISDALLLLYKRVLSPLLHAAIGSPGACRFQPTCSEYAAIAVHARGPLRGLALAAWRVLRCHPLSRGGFDPVPGTWPPSTRPPEAAREEGDGAFKGHKQAVHLP